MKLNLMISHKLADDYVMVDLFNFGYDLLQSRDGSRTFDGGTVV
jgi:hypothetical protein